MNTKILLMDHAPSIILGLGRGLEAEGVSVGIVEEDPEFWPLSGGEAADFIIQDFRPHGKTAGSPEILNMEPEQAGYLPVVVFCCRVNARALDDSVPAPTETGESAQTRALQGYVGTLLKLQHAILEPGRQAADNGVAADFHSQDLFHSCLSREFARSDHREVSISCVLATMEGMGELPISSSLTHQRIKDRVVREYFDLLREGVRASDFVCKYDASTFALLLDETGMEGARQCIDRLSSLVQNRTFGRFGQFEVVIQAQWELCTYCRSIAVDCEDTNPFVTSRSCGNRAGVVHS